MKSTLRKAAEAQAIVAMGDAQSQIMEMLLEVMRRQELILEKQELILGKLEEAKTPAITTYGAVAVDGEPPKPAKAAAKK